MKKPLASSTAFLGTGTEYHGRLNFKGSVRIDGVFSGDILSDGELILGPDARIDGVVNVGELSVLGKLSGEVTVTRKTILYKSAKVTANVTTALLVMEEGALLEGQVQMGKELAETKANSLRAACTAEKKPLLQSTIIEQ